VIRLIDSPFMGTVIGDAMLIALNVCEEKMITDTSSRCYRHPCAILSIGGAKLVIIRYP
jgi:hypothetical protein